MRIAVCILGIVAALIILAFIGLEGLIGVGVEHDSQNAMRAFPGDRIEALIAVVDCQGCDLRNRNQAVWALGQLRDKRALPVLYKYRTGKKCDHFRFICQYELAKAIRWTEGNAYVAPQLWRLLLSRDRGCARTFSQPLIGATVTIGR